MLLNASKTMPLGRAPSPMTATGMADPIAPSKIVGGLQARNRGGRCTRRGPVMNRSNGLSFGFGKPINPPPGGGSVWNFS